VTKTKETQPYSLRSHRDKNRAFSELKPRVATACFMNIRKIMNIFYQNTMKNT